MQNDKNNDGKLSNREIPDQLKPMLAGRRSEQRSCNRPRRVNRRDGKHAQPVPRRTRMARRSRRPQRRIRSAADDRAIHAAGSKRRSTTLAERDTAQHARHVSAYGRSRQRRDNQCGRAAGRSRAAWASARGPSRQAPATSGTSPARRAATAAAASGAAQRKLSCTPLALLNLMRS